MNKETKRSHDIQINSQQKIKDTLKILKDAGIMSEIQLESIKVKSVRKRMYINIEKSYEEEQINSGDRLELDCIE